MIYALATMKVSSPEKLGQYREAAGAALAKHGGVPVSGGGEFTVLDGAPDVPDMAALLSFPDKAAAVAWANDPELADVHALRRSAGESNILLLG